MKFLLVVAFIAVIGCTSAFHWNSEEFIGSWAMDCDFKSNDIEGERLPGDQCSKRCQQTACCTHYVWTNYQGGTCWMKKGSTSKGNAVWSQGAVCDIIESNFEPCFFLTYFLFCSRFHLLFVLF